MPLPLPLRARCAVPGGARGPGFGFGNTSQAEIYVQMDIRTYRFTLWVPDGLIHAEDQTCGFRCTADCVGFDKTGFPYESVHIVADTVSTVNIDSSPLLSFGMFHAKFIEDVGGV